jgi:hypothetical protein
VSFFFLTFFYGDLSPFCIVWPVPGFTYKAEQKPISNQFNHWQKPHYSNKSKIFSFPQAEISTPISTS